MSRRDPVIALRHMLDYAREALAISRGHNRAEIHSDRSLQLQLARVLQIVGEAANRVPADVQQRHAGIPWADIIGLRNRLVHAYDIVDYDVVWGTVVDDLNPLIAALEATIADEEARRQ